jgi:hypothetical protein
MFHSATSSLINLVLYPVPRSQGIKRRKTEAMLPRQRLIYNHEENNVFFQMQKADPLRHDQSRSPEENAIIVYDCHGGANGEIEETYHVSRHDLNVGPHAMVVKAESPGEST